MEKESQDIGGRAKTQIQHCNSQLPNTRQEIDMSPMEQRKRKPGAITPDQAQRATKHREAAQWVQEQAAEFRVTPLEYKIMRAAAMAELQSCTQEETCNLCGDHTRASKTGETTWVCRPCIGLATASMMCAPTMPSIAHDHVKCPSCGQATAATVATPHTPGQCGECWRVRASERMESSKAQDEWLRLGDTDRTAWQYWMDALAHVASSWGRRPRIVDGRLLEVGCSGCPSMLPPGRQYRRTGKCAKCDTARDTHTRPADYEEVIFQGESSTGKSLTGEQAYSRWKGAMQAAGYRIKQTQGQGDCAMYTMKHWKDQYVRACEKLGIPPATHFITPDGKRVCIPDDVEGWRKIYADHLDYMQATYAKLDTQGAPMWHRSPKDDDEYADYAQFAENMRKPHVYVGALFWNVMAYYLNQIQISGSTFTTGGVTTPAIVRVLLFSPKPDKVMEDATFGFEEYLPNGPRWPKPDSRNLSIGKTGIPSWDCVVVYTKDHWNFVEAANDAVRDYLPPNLQLEAPRYSCRITLGVQEDLGQGRGKPTDTAATTEQIPRHARCIGCGKGPPAKVRCMICHRAFHYHCIWNKKCRDCTNPERPGPLGRGFWPEQTREENPEPVISSDATTQEATFGTALTIPPIALGTRGNTCFIASTMQAMLRLGSCMYNCHPVDTREARTPQGETPLGQRIIKLHAAMISQGDKDTRKKMGIQQAFTDVVEFVRAQGWQRSDQGIWSMGDPGELIKQILGYMTTTGEPTPITKAFAQAWDVSYTCRGCEQYTLMAKRSYILEIDLTGQKSLQSVINKKFEKNEVNERCNDCKGTKQTRVEKLQDAPASLMVKIKREPTATDSRIATVIQLDKRQYTIAAVIQAEGQHFTTVVRVERRDGEYEWWKIDDDDSAPEWRAPREIPDHKIQSELARAYLLLYTRTPKHQAHNENLALELPCSECDVPGCGNGLRQRDVRVAGSKQAQGQGLFARVDLPAQTYVASFGATRVRTTAQHTNYGIRVTTTGTNKPLYVIPIDEYGHQNYDVAAKVNHTCCETHKNAIFVHNGEDKTAVAVYVKTIKPVKAGEEILAHYGERYRLPHCQCCKHDGRCKG